MAALLCGNGHLARQFAKAAGNRLATLDDRLRVDLVIHLANGQFRVEIGEQGVDLLLFAGGDGTARNICAAVGDQTTVLGIPAGVKIHSGVYAISPQAAGKLVAKLIAGELVSLSEAPVMDIDEQAFRSGVVKARRYGEMRIPAQLRYIQSVKMGGRESEELVLADLAAYVAAQLEDDVRYVMGSGSTVAAVMAELGSSIGLTTKAP